MYEEYITAEKTPAGKVLEHILRRSKMTQHELAVQSGIYPQRIHELIKGIRKFTIQYSLSIEKVLGINMKGYFYKIQANYDIYKYISEKENSIKPETGKFSKALFWDIKIENINWQENKAWIIQRVFEYGNNQEIEEIIKLYGKETIKEILSNIKSEWKKDDRERNFKEFIL